MKTLIAFALLATAALAESPFEIPPGEFAENVVAECPELEDPEADDWDRVRALTRWAWSNTQYAPNVNSTAWFHPDGDENAAEFYSKFAGGHGTLCGGTAFGLSRLCREFGFRSKVVTHGERGRHHSQALTIIEHDGREIAVILDATFGVHFRDQSTGGPIDYVDLLGRLKRREHTSIEVVSLNYREVDRWPSVIVPAEDMAGKTPARHALDDMSVADYCYTVEARPNGDLRFTSPRLWAEFVRKQYHWKTGEPAAWLAGLIEAGWPPSILYIYLEPAE